MPVRGKVSATPLKDPLCTPLSNLLCSACGGTGSNKKLLRKLRGRPAVQCEKPSMRAGMKRGAATKHGARQRGILHHCLAGGTSLGGYSGSFGYTLPAGRTETSSAQVRLSGRAGPWAAPLDERRVRSQPALRAARKTQLLDCLALQFIHQPFHQLLSLDH